MVKINCFDGEELMSPEERQLLVGLFERTKNAASAPRDAEAEAFIADQVRSQPAATYLLAQTVIVQEQALEGANARIKQLEAQLKEAEGKRSSGFLGGLFSPRPTELPQRQAQRPTGPWGNPPPYAPPPPQGYAPEPGGGSFLRGALGTAAGVAGGVLLADSIRNLFFHPGMGGMSNLGIGTGFTPTGDTTIINNYYGDKPDNSGFGDHSTQEADYPSDGYDSGFSSDAGYDDSNGFDSGGDGGFDV